MVQYQSDGTPFKPGQLFDPTTFSPEQAAALNNVPGQSLSATNTPAQILAAQNLTPNIPVGKTTPATPLGITNPAPTNTGVTSYSDYLSMLQGGTPSATQTAADKLRGEVTALLPSDTGRGAAQLQAEQDAGVGTLKSDLADVNAQILQKTAEYNQLNTQIEGKPITMNSIIGAEAQTKKAAAAEIGLLQSIALGKQGMLSAAQSAADRAVDLKYDDIESQINIRLKQLDLLQPTLDAEEKKKSDALQLYLQDQKTAAAEQKATDKSFQTLKIQGLSNGMPASVAQQAQALYDGGQADQAYASMSSYTGTKTNDVNSGASGAKTFTTTQLNKGAITGKMSIDDFKGLDVDTQNFFINNAAAVTAKYKAIDAAKSSNEDPSVLEKEIAGSNAPAAVKDAMTKYLWSVFPKPTAKEPGFFSRIWNAIF